MPLLMTRDDVAEALQCSPRMVSRLVQSGELQSMKVERLLRFRPDDVQAFVDGSLDAQTSGEHTRREAPSLPKPGTGAQGRAPT